MARRKRERGAGSGERKKMNPVQNLGSLLPASGSRPFEDLPSEVTP